MPGKGFIMDEIKIRNEFVRGLEDMPPEYAQKAIASFERILRKYSVTPRSTALSTEIYHSPDLLELYLKLERISGRPENSMENYDIYLHKFFGAIRKEPSHITQLDIVGFLNYYLQERQVSPDTINYIRIILHAFFSWAVSSGYVPSNPVDQVKPLNTNKKQRDYLTDEELEQVRAACQNPRDVAMIEVMISTACRISELIQIKLSDINFKTWTIKVLGKGSKYRTVKLTPRARTAVMNYLGDRMPLSEKLSLIVPGSSCLSSNTEYLFSSSRAPYGAFSPDGFRRIFDMIIDRAGLTSGKHVTPHTIRHTWATLALQKGMPLEQVSKYLGHAELSTTMIYVTLSDDELQRNVIKYAV